MAIPDFSEPTKRIIRHRAGFICSNPSCRQPTLLPSSENEDKYFEPRKQNLNVEDW